MPPAGRLTRIQWQVRVRSMAWETVLPFWHVLAHQEEAWPAFASRTDSWRKMRIARLGDYYAPELRGVADARRQSLLLPLDAMTDYTAWARLREIHGRSPEEAQEVWVFATDRLLPHGVTILSSP